MPGTCKSLCTRTCSCPSSILQYSSGVEGYHGGVSASLLHGGGGEGPTDELHELHEVEAERKQLFPSEIEFQQYQSLLPDCTGTTGRVTETFNLFRPGQNLQEFPVCLLSTIPGILYCFHVLLTGDLRKGTRDSVILSRRILSSDEDSHGNPEPNNPRADGQRKPDKVKEYKEDVIVVHIYIQEQFYICSKS